MAVPDEVGRYLGTIDSGGGAERRFRYPTATTNGLGGFRILVICCQLCGFTQVPSTSLDYRVLLIAPPPRKRSCMYLTGSPLFMGL